MVTTRIKYRSILIIGIMIVSMLALGGCQTATEQVTQSAQLEIEEAAPQAEAPTQEPPPTDTSPPPSVTSPPPTDTRSPTATMTETPAPSSTPRPIWTVKPSDTPGPSPIPVAMPRPRSDPAMTYDRESDRMIVFGGVSSFDCQDRSAVIDDSTWSLDLNTKQWMDMQTDPGPAAVSGGYMAYDAESDRAILFGGYDKNIKGVGDTWAYDFNTNTWTHMAEGPSPRSFARMVYDSESDRIILFGGVTMNNCNEFMTPNSFLNDTWAYDYNSDTWMEMQPSDAPPERHSHFMAYDAESDRVILFGGVIAKNDTWAYDYNGDTWEKLASQTIAAANQWGGMAYDSQADRIVAHGMGETWLYDYNADAWEKANVNSSGDDPPNDLNGFAIVYNSALDRTVVFAGCLNIDCMPAMSNYVDVWLYDLNSSTWEKMEVSP